MWPRLNFVDKPAPHIASIAIKILAKVLQAEFPEAAKELQEWTYVDDIGGSRPTTVEAKHVTSSIDEVLGKGQFQIKAWHSNKQEVDQANDEWFTDLLGHRWDKQEDTFSLQKDSVVRLRTCLTPLGKVCDPIGLVAPVTQILNWSARARECWIWLGRHHPRSNLAKMKGEQTNYVLTSYLQVWLKTEAYRGNWSTSSTWLCRWRRTGVWCYHFPLL